MPGDDYKQPDRSMKPVQTLKDEALGDPRKMQPGLVEVLAKVKRVHNGWRKKKRMNIT